MHGVLADDIWSVKFSMLFFCCLQREKGNGMVFTFGWHLFGEGIVL